MIREGKLNKMIYEKGRSCMKKTLHIFLMMLTIVASVCLIAPDNASAANFQPDLAVQEVNVSLDTMQNPGIDETVTIPIRVDEVGKIGGFSLYFDYDRTQLEFAGWDGTGSVFGQGFNFVTTRSTLNDVNIGDHRPMFGFANVAAINFEDDANYGNPAGPAILGSIKFKVLQEVKADIGIEVDSAVFTYDPVLGSQNMEVTRYDGILITLADLDECFIATAAYGTKFTPAVTLLRQFRDKHLLNNTVGTAFVDFYYRTSQPIANFIAGSELLKGIVRVTLIPAVVTAYMIINPLPGLAFMMAIVGIFAIGYSNFRRFDYRGYINVSVGRCNPGRGS